MLEILSLWDIREGKTAGVDWSRLKRKTEHIRGGSEEATVTQKIVEQVSDAGHGAKGFGICPPKFRLSLVWYF